MVLSSAVSANTEVLVYTHRINRRSAAFLIAAFSFGPLAASAQLPWESPILLRPGAPRGVTVMAVDYGLDPHNGLGAMMSWRSDDAPHGLGFRFAAALGLGDKLNYAGGFDRSGPLLSGTTQFPMELIWFTGAGATYGEYVQVAVPLGVAVGRSSTSRAAFNPYVSARGVFEARFGRAAPDSERSLGLAIDVGADLALGRTRKFLLRSAASLGDRPTIALGMHVGGPPAKSTISSLRKAN